MLLKMGRKAKIIKIALNIICKILLAGVLLTLLLLISSANWFLETFGEMDFSIVVYQLLSPMEGTSSEILGEYYSVCLRPVVSITVLIMVIYTFCDAIFKKCFLSIEITIIKRKISLLINRKSCFITKWVLLVTGLAVLAVAVYHKAIILGIPAYVAEITNPSTLFEEEYIDPNDVELTFPQDKRNLLLIYMESMEMTYASVEEGGAKPVNYIPELTELAKQNLNFSDSEKLGGGYSYTDGWTIAALLASGAGVPYKLPIEGNSAGEYESFLPGLTCLGDILYEEGYKNYFMCGSDATFGGREAFYLQHGNYEILDYDKAKLSGVIPEDYQVYWGMEDQKLYQYAKQELTNIAANDEPFNFTMLTVDTHHPDGYICELCEEQYPEAYANAIVCASRQVSEFVDWVQEQEWYADTTVIIVGDHTSMNATFWNDIGDYERNIYNCFMNYPNDLNPVSAVNRQFTNVDMFPTFLAALDVEIEGERLGLGVNLFSSEPTLLERLGREDFIKGLKMYSKFYFSEFVAG